MQVQEFLRKKSIIVGLVRRLTKLLRDVIYPKKSGIFNVYFIQLS